MTRSEDRRIVTYRTLRLFLGCLGLALPVALLIGGLATECCVRPSISAFYHSQCPILHGLFVGIIAAIGAFLVCYKGHEKGEKEHISDNLIATAAGIGAFGIALFPTDPSRRVECWVSCFGSQLSNQSTFMTNIFSNLHDVSSLVFFVAIALMTGKRFTKSKNKLRKTIYYFCTALIAVSIVPIVIDSKTNWIVLDFDRYSVVFWLEALAVWAFGAAWLTKGWPKRRWVGPFPG